MITTEAEFTARKRKSELGQFFTSGDIARFMAAMFRPGSDKRCVLLDAGAGRGSLSEAFLDRWMSGGFDFEKVQVDAFEIDESLIPDLSSALEKYNRRPGFSARIRNVDFIRASTDRLSGSFFAEQFPRYTHAILNPPYKKIPGDSAHRAALKRAGLDTVNLYSAFVALSLSLLNAQGQLVAIIPRSFCNGPYYRSFRAFLLVHAAIHHIHLFESRAQAFKQDDVLQENVIILLERGGLQGPVTVSTSTDSSFTDLISHEHAFEKVLPAEDPEQVIHVPTSPEANGMELIPSICHSLNEIDVEVSTGPVVDFRVRQYLRPMPGENTVPLLYPGHFSEGQLTWPLPESRKPNAIELHEDTRKWLYPKGYYCVVRRFSSKEEKRRIVASVVDPHAVDHAALLGFENHLNILHKDKQGLPELLARGLSVYLNTTAVDEQFRRFNGHTQVNATDLKRLKYPSRSALMELGYWARQQDELSQALIDEKFDTMKFSL